MERKIGLFSVRAFSKASGPQGNQSTGLCACWRRYGLCSAASRFIKIPLSSEFIESGGEALARFGRDGTDGLAAGADGASGHAHGFLEHAREGVGEDPAAHSIDELLEALGLRAALLTPGAVQVDKQARGDVGERGHRAGEAVVQRGYGEVLGADEDRQALARDAVAVGVAELETAARVLDAHEVFAAGGNA